MVKYIQEGWVKWLLNWIAASSAFIPPWSRTVTLSNETNKRTSLHCKPLIRSKNEGTKKRTTLLQSTLCGQISPITKEENTPLSPMICIHGLQLDRFWFFFYRAQVVVVVNRSLFKFSWLLNAKSSKDQASSTSANLFCPARALRALGLLMADGAPIVGGGKTFWPVN